MFCYLHIINKGEIKWFYRPSSNFHFDSLQEMNVWLGGYSNPPLSIFMVIEPFRILEPEPQRILIDL